MSTDANNSMYMLYEAMASAITANAGVAKNDDETLATAAFYKSMLQALGMQADPQSVQDFLSNFLKAHQDGKGLNSVGAKVSLSMIQGMLTTMQNVQKQIDDLTKEIFVTLPQEILDLGAKVAKEGKELAATGSCFALTFTPLFLVGIACGIAAAVIGSEFTDDTNKLNDLKNQVNTDGASLKAAEQSQATTLTNLKGNFGPEKAHGADAQNSMETINTMNDVMILFTKNLTPHQTV